MQAKVTSPTALAFVAGLLGAACSAGPPPPPHGAPVLTAVYWIAGGPPLLAWTPADAPSSFLVSPVPPFATQVDFVFDRRLDGDLIEDTVIVDGIPTTQPKAMPPIEVQWPGMADRPGDPPLALRVAYNSAGLYGPDTSYVFAKPQPQGFPSSETLMFVLHREALASSYGEPADAPEKIPVTTSALTAAIAAPAAPVALKFQLPIVFTNRLAPLGTTSPFIHVKVGGGAVPYKLLADASQLSRWYVAPADCLKSWPGGASLVVTVDAGLPDAFGGTLVQSATATFTTNAGPITAAGASCAVEIPDAGTTDGGMDGGAADGGAADGGATDGGAVDGGAPEPIDAAADVPASFDDGAAPDTADAGDASDTSDDAAVDAAASDAAPG